MRAGSPGVLPPGRDPFEVKGGDPPQARRKAGGGGLQRAPSLQWEGGQSGTAGTWSPQIELCCGVTCGPVFLGSAGHTSQATVPCRAMGPGLWRRLFVWGPVQAGSLPPEAALAVLGAEPAGGAVGGEEQL